MFECEAKPLLRPRTAAPFEISRWFDSHWVQKYGHAVFERGLYSVPSVHIVRGVDLRMTDTTLNVFAEQDRLTSHLLAPAGAVNRYRTRDSGLPDGPQYRHGVPYGLGKGPRESGRTPRPS